MEHEAASAVITGIGTALPRGSMTQQDAAESAVLRCCETDKQQHLLATLYRRTLIERRGSVLLDPNRRNGSRHGFYPAPTGRSDQGPSTAQRMDRYAQEAPPLAGRACQKALNHAGVPPARVTHLVTVSCTGFAAPGVDLDLVTRLRLPATTQRVNVGYMGCHGAVNGLRVAAALAACDREARVLLCAVELCSLHFQYGWDRRNILANALFADGAAAVVIEASAGRTEAMWRVAATGSILMPDSADAMTWRIGDHGFEMTLSSGVPDLINRQLRPWMRQWLGTQDLSVDTIGSWAVHPGGPRILSAVEEALGICRSCTAASRRVLRDSGNMSSPTMLFILDQLRRSGAPRPVVAMGFGPGLVAEAALLR